MNDRDRLPDTRPAAGAIPDAAGVACVRPGRIVSTWGDDSLLRDRCR